MKETPAPSVQLGLTLPARCPAEVPVEVERQLVAALADLFLDVAIAQKGGGDEREDS